MPLTHCAPKFCVAIMFTVGLCLFYVAGWFMSCNASRVQRMILHDYIAFNVVAIVVYVLLLIPVYILDRLAQENCLCYMFLSHHPNPNTHTFWLLPMKFKVEILIVCRFLHTSIWCFLTLSQWPLYSFHRHVNYHKWKICVAIDHWQNKTFLSL